MDIDQQYKRRIRIEGKPNDPYGGSTTIYDMETGEMIGNIIGATIYLRVGEENIVDLTYERYTDDEEPIIETVRVDNPVVSVSAFERRGVHEVMTDEQAFQWCREREISVHFDKVPGKTWLYFQDDFLMKGETLQEAIEKVKRYSRAALPRVDDTSKG